MTRWMRDLTEGWGFYHIFAEQSTLCGYDLTDPIAPPGPGKLSECHACKKQAIRLRFAVPDNGPSPYQEDDIFDRDDWRCHLCGNEVEHRSQATKELDFIVDVDDFDVSYHKWGEVDDVYYRGVIQIVPTEVQWSHVAVVDHLSPRYWFGPDTADNVSAACWHCNTLKGAHPDNQAVRDAIQAMASVIDPSVRWTIELDLAAQLWVSLAARTKNHGSSAPALRSWDLSRRAWAPPPPPKAPLPMNRKIGPARPAVFFQRQEPHTPQPSLR